jgi:hypothetical protein
VVLFGISRTFGPYLAAIRRILISVMAKHDLIPQTKGTMLLTCAGPPLRMKAGMKAWPSPRGLSIPTGCTPSCPTSSLILSMPCSPWEKQSYENLSMLARNKVSARHPRHI